MQRISQYMFSRILHKIINIATYRQVNIEYTQNKYCKSNLNARSSYRRLYDSWNKLLSLCVWYYFYVFGILSMRLVFFLGAWYSFYALGILFLRLVFFFCTWYYFYALGILFYLLFWSYSAWYFGRRCAKTGTFRASAADIWPNAELMRSLIIPNIGQRSLWYALSLWGELCVW